MGTNAHSRISATVVNVLFAQSDPNRKGGGKKLQYREPVPPSAVKQGGERGEREREEGFGQREEGPHCAGLGSGGGGG